MATYYWVGGAGTWNSSTTTNWASSSGGAGGAGVPTSADDVIFDSASNATAYAVTIATGAVCRDLTANGPASGSVTFGGTTGTLTIYGNFTLAATGVVTNTGTGVTVTFAATTTGNVITTNGVTLVLGPVYFSGSGSYSLGSAFTTNGNAAVYFTAGSFSTNNYNMTIRNGIDISGTASLSLGSSTITLPLYVAALVATGSSTINAGTSSIVFPSTTHTLNVNGRTLYEVDFSGLNYVSLISISSSFTATNFKCSIPTSAGTGGFSATINLSANITITGTFSTYGYTKAVYRVLFNGVTTARTITAAATSLINCDFQRITAAGAAAPFTGTRQSDRGGNTNIVFSTPKTVYWNLAGSQSWDANAWALTSGGTPNVDNGPLLQDTAVFDNTGSVGTVTLIRNGHYGSIDASARTTAWTIYQGDNALFLYGDFVLGSAVSGSSQIVELVFYSLYSTTVNVQVPLNTRLYNFSGNGTQTINMLSALAPIAYGTNSFTISNMGLNTNNYNITTYTLTIASGTQSVDFGTSTISFIGAGTVFTMTSANLSAASSTISLANTTNATSQTFSGGGKTYGTLALDGGAATGQIKIIAGSNTFSNITTNKTVAWTLRFTAGTTNNFAAWNVSGSSGNLVTLNSTTTSVATLNYTGNTYVSFDYAAVSYISGRPANFKWFAGANSTNGGNNSAIYFQTPYDPTLGNLTAFFVR